MAEWLRRETRNLMGSARAGSNPAVVDSKYLHKKKLFFVIFAKEKNFFFLSAVIFRFYYICWRKKEVVVGYHCSIILVYAITGNECDSYYYCFSNMETNCHFGKGILIRPLFTGLWSLTCSALGVRKHAYAPEKKNYWKRLRAEKSQ